MDLQLKGWLPLFQAGDARRSF